MPNIDANLFDLNVIQSCAQEAIGVFEKESQKMRILGLHNDAEVVETVLSALRNIKKLPQKDVDVVDGVELPYRI